MPINEPEPTDPITYPPISEPDAPAFTYPFVDGDSPIELFINDNYAPGKLVSPMVSAFNTIFPLILYGIRLFLAFRGRATWEVVKLILLPNPFNRPNRPESVQVNGKGFDAIIKYFDVINDKLDNLSEDIKHIECYSSIVEHWQITKEAKRQMCVMLLGELDSTTGIIGSGKWQIAVPHADIGFLAGWANTFGFKKGSIQGILTLKDNSKIIIYGESVGTVENVLSSLLARLPAQWQQDYYLKTGEYKGPPFRAIEVRLRRIDYYAEGLLRNKPDKYRRFPAMLGETEN